MWIASVSSRTRHWQPPTDKKKGDQKSRDEIHWPVKNEAGWPCFVAPRRALAVQIEPKKGIGGWWGVGLGLGCRARVRVSG